MIWDELGISGGTALVVLCALYFVVKWAVRNGVQEAHARMAGEQGWGRKLWSAIADDGTASH